jgi:hypothetical protein
MNFYQRATVYLATGRSRQAAKDLETVLENKPEFTQVRHVTTMQSFIQILKQTCVGSCCIHTLLTKHAWAAAAPTHSSLRCVGRCCIHTLLEQTCVGRCCCTHTLMPFLKASFHLSAPPTSSSLWGLSLPSLFHSLSFFLALFFFLCVFFFFIHSCFCFPCIFVFSFIPISIRSL